MNTKRRFRSDKTVSLSRFQGGLCGTIVEIIADVELQGRLMGLGLFAGTRFQLLRSGTTDSNIPFLLAIGETRIALDHNIAESIFVEP